MKTNSGQETRISVEFTPTIKVIDAAEGLVEYVASDESLDSGREVILASGWTFERLRRNPIFVDSHNYWSVGAALGKVTSWRVDAGKRQLIEVVKWAIDVKENALAQLGFAMTEKGYLRACSIGAMVVEALWRDDQGFAEALKGTALSEDERMQVRRVIAKQDQYELSACVVGANPNAIARALDEGAVSEGLLARCGFNTDEKLETLKVASDICSAPGTDAVMREAARLNVMLLMRGGGQRTFRRDGGQTRRGDAPSADAAKRRGAAASSDDPAMVERRRGWMDEALKALESVNV